MFSGIVERLGKVVSVTGKQGSISCRISTGFKDLALGESVAVNGVCLTVAALRDIDESDFFASPETLARSNLATLQSGSIVNLERAVNLNTRLSGHLVQGHVDGKAVLRNVKRLPVLSVARKLDSARPGPLLVRKSAVNS